jgi:hypothetical protein
VELIENTKIFVEHKTLLAETFGVKFYEMPQFQGSFDIFRAIAFLQLARDSSTIILKTKDGFEKELNLSDKSQLSGYSFLGESRVFTWNGKYHPVKNFKILEES